MVKTFRLDEFGFDIELGKFAQQADGSVWFKHGGTILLATAVSAPSKEFPGFFPLVVDYREQPSAAGKIPGGYYKREGKSSDHEVLTSRLIDRSIRPLFPSNYFDQVQIIVTVYSVDKEHSPDSIALVAGSLALSISKIPFMGPVGAVEIGRVNGNWVVNPKYPDAKTSDVRLMVSGTDEGICMVEGVTNELGEDALVDALFFAHTAIKKIVAWQVAIQKEVGVTKELPDTAAHRWQEIEAIANNYLDQKKIATLFVEGKAQRNEARRLLADGFMLAVRETIPNAPEIEKIAVYIYDTVLKKGVTEYIFASKKRADLRAYDQIRTITTEVGLLPFTHGSALFTRGETQALVSVTLGGGQDEQRIENIMSSEEELSSFMLHYNFPPFSVGEVRGLRAPGRREIGHGFLAATAFKFLLPSKDEFPYTIRVVADMLGSNGSTSMATACGSTMALMNAGVPIKKMVAGIAMGLLQSTNNDFAVLSDITGFEDEFGLMDFKVVGTADGVTAIQMDVKYKGGFPREVFRRALEQARTGRLHILGEMKKVMSAPKATLSDLVPKVTTFMVPTDCIGGIIGKGGETIRAIIAATKTTIDIESTGLVKIFGGPDADTQRAIAWVKTLAGQIETGTIFEGKIRRFAEFGMFVELVPGLDGLVHVSNIPKRLQKTFARELKLDDIVKVKVLEHDSVTGRTSLKLLLPEEGA